ncbi:ATP-dependent DNA ligase [Balneola sp. MJW-20]|uniref:ATP-dependent DNA ligase n=1 Tax=Gracilimonas aurantiaca TaxID=3234185 RepID=UPI00346692B2
MNEQLNSFYRLAITAQRINETRGTNAKIRICKEYFQGLENDNDLSLAAQFLGEGAFPDVSGKRASVGSRTTSLLAAEICGIDYDLVFKPSRTATGSSSETIEKLFLNIDKARAFWSPSGLSLSEVSEYFEQLYKVSSRDDKQQILREAWSQMHPVEVKYFIRILGQGSLRIGFETRSVVNAIASAFSKEADEVRYAHMITGSLGKTAVLAREDKLDNASFRLFHPLSFMLASPIESRAVSKYEHYVAEEKFDGMRCQVHVSGNEVRLFSRDLNDITHSYPEVIDFFKERDIPDVVLDGEICVYKDETILPFQLLQKRMGLKKPSAKILEKYPVLLVSYDLLYHDDRPVFEHTLSERRSILEQLAADCGLPVTTQVQVKDEEHIEELFERALAHGNEGLMLKKKHSTYEYGQRKKSWLKVKKPGGSLDTVMMYAHAGSGKRGGKYSDFTLGISVKDDERYEEEFIPIGKAYGGYSDEELDMLNKRIKEITVERYGPTLGLLPDIVIELEFDDIQENKRTKANYTLRLPRFKAIRWDLSPSDVDTLSDVERMYQQKIDQERKRQESNPSFVFGSKSI